MRDYQAFEDGRIAAGRDPADETALAGFYADHPRGVGRYRFSDLRSRWARFVYGDDWELPAFFVGSAGLIVWKVRRDRRRKRPPFSPA